MNRSVATLLFVICSAAISAQTTRIPLYVDVPRRDGFIDASKDVLDSQRDLADKLRSGSDFALATSVTEAKVVVTVMGRGKGSQAFGVMVSTLSDGTILAGPMVVSNYWVLAVLRVGTYQRAFQCDVNNLWRSSPWADCAGKIADDIRAWTRANTEQLK